MDGQIESGGTRTEPGRLGLEDTGSAGWSARSTFADRIDDALDRLDRVRERPSIVVGGLALVAVLVVAGWWTGRSPGSSRPVEELIPQVSLATTTPSAPVDGDEAGELLVHVAGAVLRPGVYPMPADARVLDAVQAAGGATPAADLHQLNLAAPLVDGLQIRVPVEGEIVAPVGAGPAATGPVDLNQADAAALDELPGIGPATATAIVGWRDENGPFTSVDDLLLVPGIGPAKLAALTDLVTV